MSSKVCFNQFIRTFDWNKFYGARNTHFIQFASLLCYQIRINYTQCRRDYHYTYYFLFTKDTCRAMQFLLNKVVYTSMKTKVTNELFKT